MSIISKIQELKNLAIAHDCALEYDYVPNEDEAPSLISTVLDDKVYITDLINILNEYEGSSCDDIERKILMIIEKL